MLPVIETISKQARRHKRELKLLVKRTAHNRRRKIKKQLSHCEAVYQAEMAWLKNAKDELFDWCKFVNKRIDASAKTAAISEDKVNAFKASVKEINDSTIAVKSRWELKNLRKKAAVILVDLAA